MSFSPFHALCRLSILHRRHLYRKNKRAESELLKFNATNTSTQLFPLPSGRGIKIFHDPAPFSLSKLIPFPFILAISTNHIEKRQPYVSIWSRDAIIRRSFTGYIKNIHLASLYCWFGRRNLFQWLEFRLCSPSLSVVEDFGMLILRMICM